MAKLNTKPQRPKTHQGAPVKVMSYEQALRRSVLSCMLWEDEFYESGVSIARRIEELVPKCDPRFVADLAVGARQDMHLRHVPLWLIRSMLHSRPHKKYIAQLLAAVIQRPDEIAEFMAMYWKDGKCPIAAQVKKGLAAAFGKFNAYQLAKWQCKDKDVKLADVMRLCRPKPKNHEQAVLWHKLLGGNLPAPDTWEVALSAKNESKYDIWTRLLSERKLGSLALLRNLRNMTQADVPETLLRDALRDMDVTKIMPFRFIAAANQVPYLEDALEEAMVKSLQSQPKIDGHTVLLVDVSGSMDFHKISERSQMTRFDAACALAMLARELCTNVSIYTFSTKLVRVAPRRGFALAETIRDSQKHSSTYLGSSVKAVYRDNDLRIKGRYSGHLTFEGQGLSPDRLIVITDEQSDDPVPDPLGPGYMINVASYKYGVGYGPWVHLDGWSPSVLSWIYDYEQSGY